jgi:DNA-binding CsgD family transcriptional regulator/predicted transcriptional regulator
VSTESTRGPNVLDALGIDAHGESVYSFILSRGAAAEDEIAEGLSLSAAHVHLLLGLLQAQGLVTRRRGERADYAPVDPRYALRSATHRLSEDIRRIHDRVPFFSSMFDQGAAAVSESSATLVLTDPHSTASWYSRLQHEVQSEFLAFDRPPYITALDDPLEPLSMGRGVRWRAIYSASSFDVDGAWAKVQSLIRQGEESRVASDLPLKLAIADRRVALASLSDHDGRVESVVTHAPLLVTALGELFDFHWAKAIPVGESVPSMSAPTDSRPPSSEERALLSLIGAGLKDESIARQLGLSPRTLRRRTQELFKSLGVENRFQAGVEAARRGWV